MDDSNYKKILNSLEQRIEDGIYKPEQKLPEIDVLAEEHGVSVMAVEQALKMLEKEGLVTSKEGLGFFIKSPGSVKNSVLIVEDESNIMELLKDFLSSKGYTCVTAKNGIEAINAIQRQGFNLVTLDLRIPELHGCEVLKIIKKTRPGTPVIVISGHPEDLENANINNILPEAVIRKPFKLNLLNQTLAKVKSREQPLR